MNATLVVIFGAAVRPDGTASAALARRVGYAAAYAENDPTAILFCSGGVGRHGPSEASVMATLLENSIARERIVLDEHSQDTLQTVRAAAAYARRHEIAAIVTATDRYHQPRVRMLFVLLGLRSRAIPMPRRGAIRRYRYMQLREAAAIPYDLVAGGWAAWRGRKKRRRQARTRET